MLPDIARKAHTFPNIKHSLVSIGASFDAGCTVTFKIKYVTVVYKYEIILQGWINNQNNLWYFPLSVENEYDQVGDVDPRIYTRESPHIYIRESGNIETRRGLLINPYLLILLLLY